MSTFKELVQADIFGTFLNADEFADEHSIDGRPMKVVLDGNELIERTVASGVKHADGVYKRRLLLYVAAEDYGPRPKLGKLLLLDGKKRYIITDVTDEDGIYSFELEAATT